MGLGMGRKRERKSTYQYVAEKQAQIAASVHRSTWCAHFFSTLRLLNVMGAVGIMGVAIALAVLAGKHIADADEKCNDEENDCFRVALDDGTRAATFLIIAIFFISFASLIIAADGCKVSMQSIQTRTGPSALLTPPAEGSMLAPFYPS